MRRFSYLGVVFGLLVTVCLLTPLASAAPVARTPVRSGAVRTGSDPIADPSPGASPAADPSAATSAAVQQSSQGPSQEASQKASEGTSPTATSTATNAAGLAASSSATSSTSASPTQTPTGTSTPTASPSPTVTPPAPKCPTAMSACRPYAPDSYNPPEGARFNNPLGTTAAVRRNLTHVIRTINSVPGYPVGTRCPTDPDLFPAEIKISLYSMADRGFANALVNADKRCISVQLMMNSHLDGVTVPAFGMVQTALGDRPERTELRDPGSERGSWVRGAALQVLPLRHQAGFSGPAWGGRSPGGPHRDGRLVEHDPQRGKGAVERPVHHERQAGRLPPASARSTSRWPPRPSPGS